jgi:hypothetical protein
MTDIRWHDDGILVVAAKRRLRSVIERIRDDTSIDWVVIVRTGLDLPEPYYYAFRPDELMRFARENPDRLDARLPSALYLHETESSPIVRTRAERAPDLPESPPVPSLARAIRIDASGAPRAVGELSSAARGRGDDPHATREFAPPDPPKRGADPTAPPGGLAPKPEPATTGSQPRSRGGLLDALGGVRGGGGATRGEPTRGGATTRGEATRGGEAPRGERTTRGEALVLPAAAWARRGAAWVRAAWDRAARSEQARAAAPMTRKRKFVSCAAFPSTR